VWHLGWGLPELYEEATPLFRAWGLWNWGGAGLDLNPHFFNYPALSFVIQFLLQVAHAGVGFVLGLYPDLRAFQEAWSTDFPRFVLIGRLPGVLADAGTVAAAGVLAGRLVSRRAGLIAAGLVAVNPLHVRLSHMIVVDSMLAFFCTAALLALVDLSSSGGTRTALLGGILVGLAAATKYTGAVLIAPLALAALLGMRAGRGSGASPLARAQPAPGVASGRQVASADGDASRYSPPPAVGLAAPAAVNAILCPLLLAAGVFFVVNPFILMDYASFERDFGFEQAHMSQGHFGVPSGASSLQFYVWEALPGSVGWPAMVLAVLGLLWAVRRRDSRWMVLGAGLGFLLLMPMLWTMRAERYLMPAIPVMLVLASAGLEWFWGAGMRLGLRRRPKDGVASGRAGLALAGTAALLLVSFASPLAGTAAYHRSMTGPDTRAGASAWIERNLPAGALIALTPVGVNVDSSYVQFPIPYLAVGLEGIAAVYDARWYTDMDLVVGSDFDRARFAQEPERYGECMRFFYDSLDARWSTVWTAAPGPDRQGPRISLYAPPPGGNVGPFPADLLERLHTVTASRTLTVFAVVRP
jgi:hypothetical protein